MSKGRRQALCQGVDEPHDTIYTVVMCSSHKSCGEVYVTYRPTGKYDLSFICSCNKITWDQAVFDLLIKIFSQLLQRRGLYAEC